MPERTLIWNPNSPTAKRVILLRHAEKTGQQGDRGLSPKGHARAQALASLPEFLGRIDAIIAAKSSNKSARPVQTVEPLARALDLPIETQWDTYDIVDLATTVTGDAHGGKQVVICWRHDTIQALAHALGAPDAPVWPADLYDRVWLLTRSSGGTNLRTLRQHVRTGMLQLEL